ncbi:MAG: T9SS type A sorting domain-containing protein [Bacteroidota bacterium]
MRPPSREVGDGAGQIQFVIFTNAVWSISSDADWVEFFGKQGTGTAFIKVNYDANTTGETRVAELDVVTSTGQSGTFTLTQTAAGAFIINNPDSDANTATIANFDLTVYPNPVSALLNVRIDADEDRAIDVQVLDINGKVVRYYNSQPVFRGENTIQIDVNDLTNGIYYFRMLGQDVVKQTKFMVAH